VDVAGADDDSGEPQLTAQVREALRADAATSPFADRLVIATVGSTVVLRGAVDSLEDGDAVVEAASRVPEVDEVRDETEVPGLG
jgi:osmotically-inducible protein OsmY